MKNVKAETMEFEVCVEPIEPAKPQHEHQNPTTELASTVETTPRVPSTPQQASAAGKNSRKRKKAQCVWTMCKRDVMDKYLLTNAEAEAIPYKCKPNPYHINGADLKIYRSDDVEAAASRIWGGAEGFRMAKELHLKGQRMKDLRGLVRQQVEANKRNAELQHLASQGGHHPPVSQGGASQPTADGKRQRRRRQRTEVGATGHTARRCRGAAAAGQVDGQVSCEGSQTWQQGTWQGALNHAVMVGSTAMQPTWQQGSTHSHSVGICTTPMQSAWPFGVNRYASQCIISPTIMQAPQASARDACLVLTAAPTTLPTTLSQGRQVSHRPGPGLISHLQQSAGQRGGAYQEEGGSALSAAAHCPVSLSSMQALAAAICGSPMLSHQSEECAGGASQPAGQAALAQQGNIRTRGEGAADSTGVQGVEGGPVGKSGVQCKAESRLQCKSESGLQCRAEPGAQGKAEDGIWCKAEEGVWCKVEPGVQCKAER